MQSALCVCFFLSLCRENNASNSPCLFIAYSEMMMTKAIYEWKLGIKVNGYESVQYSLQMVRPVSETQNNDLQVKSY